MKRDGTYPLVSGPRIARCAGLFISKPSASSCGLQLSQDFDDAFGVDVITRSRISMNEQQFATLGKHAHTPLLQGVSLGFALPVPIPRSAGGMPQHLDAEKRTHSAHHAQRPIGFTIRIRTKLHGRRISVSKAAQCIDRTVSNHDQARTQCIDLRCGFNKMSHLLTTKQSAEVTDKNKHSRLFRPHRR